MPFLPNPIHIVDRGLGESCLENTVLAGRRAGFWRRFAALLIDSLIVLIPLQILVAILFAYTNGAVQGNLGFVINVCGPVNPVPMDLEPPPPDGANQATLCSSSFLGFETARTLTVSAVTTSGNTTNAIFRQYSVSADGNVRDDVFYTNVVAFLVLLGYLVLMESRTGVTFGKRALHIKVVDVRTPQGTGIPVGTAVLRYMAMLLGSAVLMVALLITYFTVETPEEMLSWLWPMNIASLIGIAWLLWIVVSVARKTDPIHDRLAGTAVVLT